MSYGTSYITCGSVITNTSISNSTIDMNGGVITNAGLPTNGTDVANKNYVDSISSGIPIINITLSSTTYTTIINVTQGNLQLFIKNVVSGGPSAIFTVNKSDPSRYPTIDRMSSDAGLTTFERLQIKWDPNGYPQLQKTGVNYDGVYQVKYLLNN